MALVLWLPFAFPGSWFINSFWAHVVFERSTDGGWHSLSGTSDGWSGSLEQVAKVLASQRLENLTINNYSLKHNGVTIIIIIMSRRQRGYPWPSLAISPYHSSPPAGLQSYILCPHIVAVCKFVLVVPLLHIHVWGSTGVHRLWARPCFSSSVLRVWFVELV